MIVYLRDSDLSTIVYQSFICEYDHIYGLDLSIIIYKLWMNYHRILFFHFLNTPDRHNRKKIQTFNTKSEHTFVTREYVYILFLRKLHQCNTHMPESNHQ
jgi:hypothetical protein